MTMRKEAEEMQARGIELENLIQEGNKKVETNSL